MATANRDIYSGTRGLTTPADNWFLVTVSDTDYLAELPKFLRIGHDGAAGPARSDLVIEDAEGSKVTLSVVPGQRVDVRPVRIWSTGTTAGVVVQAFW